MIGGVADVNKTTNIVTLFRSENSLKSTTAFVFRIYQTGVHSNLIEILQVKMQRRSFIIPSAKRSFWGGWIYCFQPVLDSVIQ